ncbi:MAG: hypothetical protein J2P36_24080 [Ktedonobacteraceae bacterium]|nr:hypothetical protein [Ktedonobacteraceae bacterium]
MTRKQPTGSTTSTSSVVSPKLAIHRDQAQQKLEAHIKKGHEIAQRSITSESEMDETRADGDKWRDYAVRLLSTLFDTPALAKEYQAKTRQMIFGGRSHFREEQELFKNRMNTWWIKELESIAESLDLIPEASTVSHSTQSDIEKDPRTKALGKIELIAQRFHIVARQLKQRHSDRATLKIEDEYDVQDLFHALLRMFFDDVRDEEWTPSYAGGASRIDFLLKAEQIVIELKMTRVGLKKKEIGDQLIIDIDRYRSTHPDCKTMFAFVYDPEEYISNPRGLESDLSREIGGIQVKVIISPH